MSPSKLETEAIRQVEELEGEEGPARFSWFEGAAAL